MAKQIVRDISVDDNSLNDLFKEILDGLRDDMQEAINNVEQYFDIIEADKDARALFGTLYHDALKIKGSARDRQLKFLNSFKERVTKKESDMLAKELKGAAKNTNSGFDHAQMNKALEQLQAGGKLEDMLAKLNAQEDINDEDNNDE